MLPQLLLCNPRTRNAKRDSGQETRVVSDDRSGQDGLDLLLVDACPVIRRLEKLDSRARDAEIAMAAAFFWDCILVAEMPRQFAAQAAASGGGGGDEVDDASDALHVTLFPRFDLRVDGIDDGVLCRFVVAPLREEVSQDAEAVDDAAGVQFDGARVIPFLELLDSVGTWEAARRGGGVHVDARPLLGGLAGLFEGFSDW